jgi:hypothetical protein
MLVNQVTEREKRRAYHQLYNQGRQKETGKLITILEDLINQNGNYDQLCCVGFPFVQVLRKNYEINF